MPTITKEALRAAGTPKTETLVIPELGPDMEIVVKGYTLRDIAAIEEASVTVTKDGQRRVDGTQDRLMSVLLAVVEPKLALEDSEWILDLQVGVVDAILGAALRLGGRTQSHYDALKDALRANPLMRQLYSVCVQHLHRLPSELADVSELEFRTALAALELDAEDMKKELA